MWSQRIISLAGGDSSSDSPSHSSAPGVPVCPIMMIRLAITLFPSEILRLASLSPDQSHVPRRAKQTAFTLSLRAHTNSSFFQAIHQRVLWPLLTNLHVRQGQSICHEDSRRVAAHEFRSAGPSSFARSGDGDGDRDGGWEEDGRWEGEIGG